MAKKDTLSISHIQFMSFWKTGLIFTLLGQTSLSIYYRLPSSTSFYSTYNSHNYTTWKNSIKQLTITSQVSVIESLLVTYLHCICTYMWRSFQNISEYFVHRLLTNDIYFCLLCVIRTLIPFFRYSVVSYNWKLKLLLPTYKCVRRHKLLDSNHK